MEIWKHTFMKMLTQLTGQPDTLMELYVLVGASVLICIAVLGKVSSVMDAKMTGSGRTFSAGILGVFLILGTMTAITLYIIPNISTQAAPYAIPVIVAVVVLAVVVPISCAIFKYGYFLSLISWAIALVAAATMIYVGGILFDTASQRKKYAGKVEDRKEALQDYIDLQ